jgi:aconitate hydratase
VLPSVLLPRQEVVLESDREGGRSESVPLVLRIDTPIEAAYFEAGGILPYVLEQLLRSTNERKD